jgi:hypothetical protein
MHIVIDDGLDQEYGRSNQLLQSYVGSKIPTTSFQAQYGNNLALPVLMDPKILRAISGVDDDASEGESNGIIESICLKTQPNSCFYRIAYLNCFDWRYMCCPPLLITIG